MLVSILAALAVGCALLGFGLHMVWRRSRRHLVRRLRRLTAGNEPPDLGPAGRLLTAIDSSRWGRGWQHRLETADLNWRPCAYAGLLLLAGAVLWTLMAECFSLPFPLDALLAGAGTRAGSELYLTARRRRFANGLARQLPDAARILANVLRAGQTVPQGMARLARELSYPTGPLFGRTHRELQLGCPLPAVLDKLAARAGCQELRLLAAILLMQRDVGGDLATALEGLGRALADRQVEQQEIRALTAEARSVAGLLPLLPSGCLLLLNLLMPGFLDVLLTLPGMLLAGIFAAVLGAVWYWVGRLADVVV